ERFHIKRRDLAQSAVTLAGVCARIRHPVLRLFGSVEQALIRNLGLHDRDDQAQREHGERCAPLHGCVAPFKVRRYATTSSNSADVSVSLYDGMADVFMIVYSRRSAFVRDTRRSSEAMI